MIHCLPCIPAVLSHDEIGRILDHLNASVNLVVKLLWEFFPGFNKTQ